VLACSDTDAEHLVLDEGLRERLKAQSAPAGWEPDQSSSLGTNIEDLPSFVYAHARQRETIGNHI